MRVRVRECLRSVLSLYCFCIAPLKWWMMNLGYFDVRPEKFDSTTGHDTVAFAVNRNGGMQLGFRPHLVQFVPLTCLHSENWVNLFVIITILDQFQMRVGQFGNQWELSDMFQNGPGSASVLFVWRRLSLSHARCLHQTQVFSRASQNGSQENEMATVSRHGVLRFCNSTWWPRLVERQRPNAFIY